MIALTNFCLTLRIPHSESLSCLIRKFANFEFWLEIKLSLAISIKSFALLCERCANKRMFALSSRMQSLLAPSPDFHPFRSPWDWAAVELHSGQKFKPPPLGGKSSEPSDGQRRTLCFVWFSLSSLILRLTFSLHDALRLKIWGLLVLNLKV